MTWESRLPWWSWECSLEQSGSWWKHHHRGSCRCRSGCCELVSSVASKKYQRQPYQRMCLLRSWLRSAFQAVWPQWQTPS